MKVRHILREQERKSFERAWTALLLVVFLSMALGVFGWFSILSWLW